MIIKYEGVLGSKNNHIFTKKVSILPDVGLSGWNVLIQIRISVNVKYNEAEACY